MTIDRNSARYQQLVDYYSQYYADAMAAQGAVVDPVAQGEYARTYADQAMLAEMQAAANLNAPAAPPAAADSLLPDATVARATAASAAAQGTAPTASATPASTVATSTATKGPTKRLLTIGIAAVAAVAVIIGAIVFVPKLFAGGGSTVAVSRVADITSSPTRVWTAIVGEDEKFLGTPWPQALPGGDILISQTFDTWAWQDAGEPTTADHTNVAVWDPKNGTQKWSARPSEVFEQYERGSISVRGGKDFVLLINYGYDDGIRSEPSEIAVLRVADGSRVSSVVLSDTLANARVVEDNVIIEVAENGDWERRTLHVLDAATLNLDTATSIPMRNAYDWSVNGDFIGLGDGEENRYYELSTGEEVPWGDGGWLLDATEAFVTASDGRLSGWAVDGERLWRTSADLWRVVDGHLFVFTRCESRSCSRIELVDSRTGESRWESPASRVYPLAVDGKRVLVEQLDRDGAFEELVWLSLATGETLEDEAPGLRHSPYVGSSAYLGTSLLYIDDWEDATLEAYKLNERRRTWSFTYDNDFESVMRLGDKLYLWSGEDRELSLLGAK